MRGGWRGEGRKQRRHMWPVPAPGTAATTTAGASPLPGVPLVAAAADSNQSSAVSFLKDGREISIGDSALFQAGNCPPFIGIVRRFAPGKEDHLKLGVNRLYRPSDVKLAKGNLLEAAPNEVFYSFQKDEISADLLLHPCKVAFLRKGVELPSGIPSFVCRRVYDIANECLWWLTDQVYINERQEEVDQLLDKTQIEMHAAVQSGGRSPKQSNGPSSTQPLKSAPDSVQSSSTSYPSQAKGRKRGEKGDLGSESIKRERSVKVDNGDSGNCKLESMIKAEIAKITDKGGLINNDAVERLVQLMQLDRGERKIDLAGRILLADVIAATDRNDCLGRFVQLRGVPVLDDWLQEAHKGKNGDGTSPKEGDKSLEELLLALLRALDKLPVNLDALQTCNIGKSVNHLRGHRNVEIQKKARSLVDTWKKRVDAEMTKLEMTKLNETKSVGSNQAVSWPGKSGFSEVSHGGNKRAGSSEVALKSGIVQTSTCKSLPAKIVHGDPIVKLNPGQSGSPKLPSTFSASVAIGTKDSQSKTGGSSWTSELPLTIKEEKSSSSSQSQNNSQSCSSDHTKSMCSTWKEDARSSAAGSMNSSKTSGGTSRHRKSSTGFVGTSVSVMQKDSGMGKSRSLSRNTTSEKVLQPGPIGEKTVDVHIADHGNNHRLIVRLPNPGRSPARSTSGGSFDDPLLTGSRASSPGAPEKNEQIDRRTKLNGDACQANIAADVNAESWQSNDLKGVVVSDDGDRSTTAVLDEERSSTDETVKALDTSRGASSSEPKSGKLFEASLSSINALIESCVKYSEASASSGGDDSGMNLLASVAAGEISKSDMISPTDSPGGNSPAAEDPCAVNEVQSTFSSDNVVTHVSGHPSVNAEDDPEKHGSIAASLQVRDEMKQDVAVSITNSFCDSKSVVSTQETKSPSDYRDQYPVSAAVSYKNPESIVKSESKLDGIAADGRIPLLTSPAHVDSLSDDDAAKQLRKKRKASASVTEGSLDCKRKARSPSSEGNGPLGDEVAPSIKCEKDSVAGTSSCPPDKQGIKDELLHDTSPTNQQIHPASSLCPSDVSGNTDNAKAMPSSMVKSDGIGELRKKESDDMGEKSPLEASDNEKNGHTSIAAPTLERRVGPSLLPTSHSVEEKFEKEVVQHHSTLTASHEEASMVPANETKQCAKSTCSKLSRAEAEEMGEKVTCSPEAPSAISPHVPDTSRNCDFDLNEGFSVDEGNSVEPVTSSAPGCSSAVHLPPFTVSPVSTVLSVPITVAAPAKGPFVPPETLLKSKGEPGWKGSAATSAFRPAEPRKVSEMPVGMSDTPSSDAISSKQCRPLLDIDLNVPDERFAEDISSQSSSQERGSECRVISNGEQPSRSSVGLDLDLNRVDDSTDNGQLSGNASRRLEVPLLQVRSGSGNGGANVLRDFDLNNGPSLDEVSSEPVPQGQHTKAGTLPFLPSLRMNNNELGNPSTWFPPGNSYPAVAIPSFLPDRDQPYPVVAAPSTQRMLSSLNGCSTFGSDLYRGPVLSSSPAMAFTPSAAFPYAGFPFGSSFPLPSTSFPVGATTHADSASGGGPCFPAIPTPLMGSAGAASSPYMRPYVISLHEGSTSSGTESSQKWGQQNLDLNAGPGCVDVEGRAERSPMASRQLPIPSSQAFAEEQARMFQAAAGRGLKRKEPEGGWDAERFAYK